MEDVRGTMEDGLDESVVLNLQPGIVCHTECNEGSLMI